MTATRFLLTTANRDIHYTIERSRRRTMAIIIRRDGQVDVKVPLRTSDTDVNSFISSKQNWILKHLGRIESMFSQQKKSYTDGEVHYFLGNRVTLNIIEATKNRVYIDGAVIIIEHKGVWVPENGEKILNTLYKKLASQVFTERLELLLEKFSSYKFKPSGLKVRTTISRWGSCSAKGSITLSTNLMKKRVELIDYVILHELCHLRHRNHGPNFYKLLEEVCPDYKVLRKELKGVD